MPNIEAFRSVLRMTRKALVYDGGMIDGQRLDASPALLVVTSETELEKLRSALEVSSEAAGHCMCCGSNTLDLLADNDVLLARIGVHHAVSLRWGRWKHDARLKDGSLLLHWFTENGITEPMEDHLIDDHEEVRRLMARRVWDNATPDCIRRLPRELSFLAELPSSGCDSKSFRELHTIEAALVHAIPHEAERILLLLHWFGSGMGPWSGYPSYENAALILLLRYSTSSLVLALDGRSNLTPVIREGATRLFADWSFRTARAGQLEDHMGRGMYLKLRAYLENTGDHTKTQRFDNAFASMGWREA